MSNYDYDDGDWDDGSDTSGRSRAWDSEPGDPGWMGDDDE